MNNLTYRAVLAAHAQARRVIDAKTDLRMMQNSLKEEEQELETNMNEVMGHLIGEEIGDLEGAWDHLVALDRWSEAAQVAMLGRDTADDPDTWRHRVREAERNLRLGNF